MKVLIIVDKFTSAIDRLAQAVKKYNPEHKIEILAVHPKRNDVDTIYALSNLMKWADVLDIHYWKSGEVVRTTCPDDFERLPKVLFHMNPYHAEQTETNKLYDMVVVGNETIQNKVPYARLIPYGIDVGFFEYTEDYTEDKIVNMCVARIEGKKGVREVAQACKDLGYKLHLVGRVSNGEYMQEVLDIGSVKFWENATDEDMREIYKGSALHVCNSVDFFESGTLPILECMSMGIPVLTRNIGHVPDIYNGKNMVVRKGAQEDLEDLKKNLKELMENREWRIKLREAGWETARNRDVRRMAKRVFNIYKSLYLPDRKMVSVIIPTKDNPKMFVESLVGAIKQDYKKFEIVVADSGDIPVKRLVEEARKNTEVPIKYIHFPDNGNYTLAEARNRAVVEAQGDILVFCDDRLKMEKDAVKELTNYVGNKTWVWGSKDGVVKGFVENFSAVHRKDLIVGGMFNERIQKYGGMTQEVRTRFEKEQGFSFILAEKAKANQIGRSKSKKSRRKDIIESKYTLFRMYEA